jgi:hypothetical protein
VPKIFVEVKDMEKLAVQFKPEEGVDLEKFWQDWAEKYTAGYLGQPGLNRYIISRFKESHGPNAKDDPNRLWGMEEFWFQDRQSYENTQKALLKDSKTRAVLAEFQSQLAWKWAAWVEERLIVDSGYTELVRSGKKLIKLQVTFRLREGQDDEDTWKLWIMEHSQDHLHCGVRKYACNRVKQVLQGDPDRIWGMPELWYENREACDFDHKEGIAYLQINPKQKQVFEDFHKRTVGNWGAFMEEKLIV